MNSVWCYVVLLNTTTANSALTGHLRWGLLSQFTPFIFSSCSESPKHYLPIEYHVHIEEVSPQLGRDDTCQIWVWFTESNW